MKETKPFLGTLTTITLALGLGLGPVAHGQQTTTQKTATAVATVEGGSVKAITVTDGGDGYPRDLLSRQSPQAMFGVVEVTISGGGGQGVAAFAEVSLVSADTNRTPIDHITLTSHGTGYITAPSIAIESPAEVKARLQPQNAAAERAQQAREKTQARASLMLFGRSIAIAGIIIVIALVAYWFYRKV